MVPSCAEGGVLGVLPGIIGCIQATELIKVILGQGKGLIGRLLLFNALDMQFREVKVRKDPACPLCGDNPTITELIDYDHFCGIPDEPEVPAENLDEVTVSEMQKALTNPALDIKVIDVREPDEYEIAYISEVAQLPLSQLNNRFTELDPNQSIYLHCKSGVRSMKALHFLREQGFKHVKSVRGGITAWSQEIDSSIPQY
jgi:adenylyltransferase/sulfurtransferase